MGETAVKRVRQSHIWARDPDEWYVEPDWVSERLFAVEKFVGPIEDPACGLGRIVHAARRAGHVAYGHDLVQRADEFSGGFDFLSDDMSIHTTNSIANVVCNPPFNLADGFVARALNVASGKVAMLLPATWHVSDRRGRWLQTLPLLRIWFLAPRPSMPPGNVIQACGKAQHGTKDFAWFTFLRGFDGCPEVRWLHRDGGIV